MTSLYSKIYFSSWGEYCIHSGANEMLMSGEKDSKSLFVGLLPHLTGKRKVNAAPWHQLYSQGDYRDPLMDVEHSSTFPKGSSLQAVPGWDMLGGQPCSLPCETKGSHLTLREKLGQITALKPGQKKHCQWGTIVVWPIIANVVMCAGAGLDFQLNSWEKCIIYWHYFANYFNAIFITALNNKP